MKTNAPPEKLRLYERLVAAAGIESKVNFGASYTAVNGNMFSMISRHGVVGIRLPDGEREAFIEKYGAEIFRADPAWPPNPEYVAVPDTLLAKTKTLTPYLERSYQYARSLQPKKSKK